MKYYELEAQSKLVKNWETINNLMWGEDEENIFFTYNGIVCYVIKKNFFIIDKEQLKVRNEKPFSIETLYNPADIYHPAQFKGIIFDKDKQLALLEAENVKVYVDMKIFKEFDHKGFTCEIKSPTNLVRVYYEGRLFALVCPVRASQDLQ